MITQHNYETYFLLYADDELDVSGRQMVETFLTLHPDLAFELTLLLQTKLQHTHTPTLTNKHQLFKPLLWDAEQLTPTQIQLLEQVEQANPLADSELAQLLQQDAELLAEWNLLAMTRLDASEATVMPNKQTLLRSGADDRRVKPLVWFGRLAVAAAVLGMGWFFVAQLSQQATPTVKTQPQTAAAKPQADKAVTPPVIVNEVPGVATKNTNVVAIAKPKASEPTPILATTKPVNEATASAQREQIAATFPEGQAVKLVQSAPLTLEIAKLEPTLTTEAPVLATEVSSPVTTLAIYNEEPGYGDDYVNIAGARIKKQKLRSVFRSVGRTIGRTLESHTLAKAFVSKPETP